MIGQGRPFSLPFTCAQRARGVHRRDCFGRAVALALVIWAFWIPASVAQQAPAGEEVRLRVTWGGGEASRWFGRFALDQGSVSKMKLLGLAADSTASIWLEDGCVHLASLSARSHDAIEVTVAANQGSKLLVELSSNIAQQRSPTPVALSELATQPYVARLDDRGNTLKIELVPPEALRIVTDREPLIFVPGEKLAFELEAALADVVPGTTLDVHTTLSPARGEGTIWANEQRMEVPVEGHPRIELEVPLPAGEGVYAVRVAVLRPSGFRERFFGPPTPLAERSFDVVVLDARPPRTTQPPHWETVLEIDPTSPHWWERLPRWTQLRRIPGLNRGPLGSIRAGSVDLPLGRFVELPPTVAGMDPHWQAYSLPLEAAFTPHLLEIDYPGNEEQHFGVSILEPNAAGFIEGVGRDSGAFVEGFGRSELKETLTHRLVFWPRTQAPLLLVANAHPTAAARFGAIRVRKLRSGRLATETAGPPSSDRLVAAYLARPLIPETFGAGQGRLAADTSTATQGASVDDWQTFYESATWLADYLRYGGYNSAVINVLADGSTLYPSAKLLPTPRYNTGRGTVEGTDRDALELLLRVFDREGLACVPAIQLAAPLPELETLRRRSDPRSSGLEWVGPDGRTWLATHGARDGLAPYYNLLEPRVQQAVLNVVRELVERCDNHPSFAGLAVQLSAHGYAQLPPLEWGLDDATISRFQRDTGIQLDATGAGRFAARHAILTGEHAAAWRSWRAAEVTKFYEQVARLVRETSSERRLLLTLEESFDHPQLAARVRPELIGENRVERVLLDLGIERRALENLPGVAVCPPRFVEPTAPLVDHAVDLEISQAAASWGRGAESAGTAAVLYHPTRRRRLASFEAKSPIPVAGQMTLAPQPLAHGTAVRQPYALALLDNDPTVLLDGGERLPLGQEDALRQVRDLLRQLPSAAEVTEHAAQPVFVRSYSEPHGTTLLVVNASAWQAEAEVTLDVSQPTTLEPLPAIARDADGTAPSSRALVAGKQPWSLSLEPYAVEAVRIVSPGVKVVEVRAEISETGKTELTERLADVANRDFTARRVYSALRNPSFEPLGGGASLPGWQVSGDGATAELDAATPQDGKTSAYLRSAGQLAVLESEPFATPPTGQLWMTVFARSQNVAAGTELRMAFEAQSAGQAYRRAFIVGGSQPGTQRLEAEWRPYAILVDDLPLDSNGRMRVRFELVGAGEVWLDNVILYDLLFPLKFYQNAQAEIKQFFILIHAAQRAFEAGRITDCVRLLESYWPRFITAYTPPVQPQIVIDDAPRKELPSSPPADQSEEPGPSVSERLKRMVPFWR